MNKINEFVKVTIQIKNQKLQIINPKQIKITNQKIIEFNTYNFLEKYKKALLK